ncbi:hypothetical protein G5B37_03610 [Rasiella rasia]|uniref:Lipoprotein n=1 Tax=Rasiella rasia TaxID=2744027 RepID=A0A6G6GJE8_9FLAO|nr:hypothetical protein [Rasiella rasia]QIE58679.1 hypothetical protein G5B37_03610 [Rasiella rasia]
MKNILLLSLILLLLISCSDNRIEKGRYVVLEYEQNTMNWIFEEGVPTELSEKELNEIEKIIEPKISNLLSRRKYYRQYVPVINIDGDKQIWINFLCGNPENDRWKTKPMYVLDGGSCFFQIKVDLSNHLFYDFWINGIAEVQPLHNNAYNTAFTFGFN